MNKLSNPEGVYCFHLGRNNLNRLGQCKLAAQKELKNFSQKKNNKRSWYAVRTWILPGEKHVTNTDSESFIECFILKSVKFLQEQDICVHSSCTIVGSILCCFKSRIRFTTIPSSALVQAVWQLSFQSGNIKPPPALYVSTLIHTKPKINF